MKISCQNCEYDRDCFQYKRNRKSECIDREYYYWKRVNIEKLSEDFISKEEMEVSLEEI